MTDLEKRNVKREKGGLKVLEFIIIHGERSFVLQTKSFIFICPVMSVSRLCGDGRKDEEMIKDMGR